uniref:Uncharacterized protein n=1 Tax=Philodina roseola TaxID=96448 RepID=B6S363_PHIRO|nr:hypothetical protein [Philodina roseola]
MTTTTTDEKPMKISQATTKEEEEILDDENIFQSRTQRGRTRNRKYGNQSDSNTPRLRENPDFGLTTLRRANERSTSIMQFNICKKCGAMMNDVEIHPAAQFSQRETFRVPPAPKEVEAVDDWFESASNVSGPRQMSPWTPDENRPSENESNNIRRNLFQPIQEPPNRSFNPFHDRSKMNVTSTPRMSETGTFTRSPETKIRRLSSSRNASRIETPSPLFNTMPSSNSVANERRMSGWGVPEQSHDDSDEN